MADNINLNLGSGGDQLAADDIGGVKYQRVKLAIGADGVDDGDISSANPLPVQSQPDAVSGFITTTPLASSATFTSSLISIGDYNQVDTRVVSDTDGTLTFEFCSDAVPTIVRTLTIPYVAADGFQLYSAPCFTPYVRYKFANSAAAQTSFYYETKLLSSALSPQILRADGFVSPSMVTTLGRAINVAYDPDSSSFKNVNTTAVTNAAGTTYNLNVVSGARPSQVFGRSRVQQSISLTADSLEYTVTGGKTFYITDVILSVSNTNAGASAVVSVQDSTVLSTVDELFALQAPEASGSTTTVESYSHTFSEPIEVSSGLFFDVQSGTPSISGMILGYEE